MFGWKHILEGWFEGWKHPTKPNFEVTRNAAGRDGIAVGGYMVLYVDDDKLRLLYSGADEERPEYLKATDKDLFEKLSIHLPKAYDSIKKRGWK